MDVTSITIRLRLVNSVWAGVNNKVILSVTNYLDRAARSLGYGKPENDRSPFGYGLGRFTQRFKTSVHALGLAVLGTRC